MVLLETMATTGSRVDLRRRMKGWFKGALLNSVLSKGQVYPCVIFILIDSTKILNGELKKLSFKKKTKDLCVIPAFYVQYVKKS